MLYYTTLAKLFIGIAPAKINPSRGSVKEDIYLAEHTGKMELHEWEGQFEDLIDGQVYSVSHLKVRKYIGVVFMTSTPFSQFIKSNDEIDMPKESASFSVQEKFLIEQFNEVYDISIMQHSAYFG